MFFYDWFFVVSVYSDFFYFVVVWSFFFLFLDFSFSYLSIGFSSSLFSLDSFFTRFLLNDMDASWDINGGSNYNFFFLFAFLNYFSLIFFQFTWLHFSIVFDLFSLFLFMWPLFCCYLFSFVVEYGFSFTTFLIGNNWISPWYVFDVMEWFTFYPNFFLRLLLGDSLFLKLSSFSLFGFLYPIVYYPILLISMIYLVYIPLACFVSYVSVFTALSVLWNVWVTSSFSILTNCFGFYSSLVVLPSWFFFCVLFLSFEGSYVLIHIILLLMLYINITSVVLMHSKKFFFVCNSSFYSGFLI